MSETVELHYTVRGEGRPVLLLHGLYGSGNNLSRLQRHLAERYRVIAPDLRNHGRSPHCPDMDYRAMAADLGALLDREGVASAAVIGHSMGGKAAMTLALTAPQRVAAVLVADIAPVAYEETHDPVIWALQAVDVASAASRGEIDAALAERVPEAQLRQFLLTNLQPAEGGGYRWRIPLETLSAAIPTIRGFPELAATYPGPALFLYGSRSEYFDAQRHRAAAEGYFPAAELQALEGAGHWLHAEQPQAFAAALDAFLAAHYPPAG